MKNHLTLLLFVFLFTAVSFTPLVAQETILCETESCHYGGFGQNDRLLWIPGLPGPNSVNFNTTLNSFHFDKFNDGTCHLYGEVYNHSNDDYGFYIDVWFHERKDWYDWSSLGRSWKGEASIVGNNYQDWDYYIVDESKVNSLTGIGSYTGSYLTLTHKPQNLLYGLQVGEAANDQNDADGLSCWFFYEGQVLGQNVTGNCDINGEGSCEQEPVMECLLDVDTDCETGFSPEITGTPELDCPGFELTYTDEFSEGCPLIITRTWTASNGNEEVVCTQTITVVDETPPVFISPPADITVSCGEIPEANIEVEEECALQYTDIQIQEQQLSGNCFPVTQRIFIAEDECGNVTSHTQYITVVDDQAPEVISPPENITIPCGTEIPEYIPTAIDNCSDNVYVSYAENATELECGSQLEQVWTISDACANAVAVSRIVTFEDNEAPQPVSELAVLELECGDEILTPEFVDACGSEIQVTVAYETEDGCSVSQEVIFTATDACGNSAEYEQTINRVDTTAPIIEIEDTDLQASCGDLGNATEPQVTDCNDVTLTYSDQYLSSEDCSMILRTWTATDVCGNESSAEQEITITDSEAPVFTTVLNDINTTCGNLTEAFIPAVIDNCDDDVNLVLTEESSAITCGVQITRTWTATDDCGNQAILSQVVTVVDESAPSITGEEIITAACGTEAGELVEVQDDCADFVTLTFTDEVLSENSCLTEVERTYTATDPCGNTSTFVQLISFVDDQAPTFEALEDLSFSCVTGESEVVEPMVSDNCSALTLTYSDSSVNVTCGTETTRTWTATDECGNTSSVNQLITVLDNEAPVFTSVPEDAFLECGAFVPEAEAVTAEDNCSSVTIEFSEELQPGACEEAYDVIRTWTATDECGNMVTHTQTISVEDNDPPVFDQQLEDITAQCGDDITVPEITATDACGGAVSVEFNQETMTGGCPNIFRTWTATDVCGNSSTMIQTIFMEDNEPPLMEGIQYNLEATCENIPDLPVPYVTDNCDLNVDVTISESVNGSGCEQILIRTWIATDDCGNTTIATQSINLIDEAPPVFINPIADNAVECQALEDLPYPQVQDNCGGEIDITFTDEILSEGCEAEILRTYTASDLCGNSATMVQTIHIIDLTPPSFAGVLAGTFVDCGSIPSAITPAIYDNCNTDNLQLDYSEQQLGEGCEYTLLRRWVATDLCGNQATAQRYIFVQDMHGPELNSYPEDVILNCNDVVPGAEVLTAVDNCSDDVTVEFSEDTELNDCGSIITRVWTSEDDCGNLTSHTQTLTIADLDAPEILNVPADLTVDCSNIPEPSEVMAIDECDEVPVVSLSEEFVTGECPYFLLRTWTATDRCGNSSSATQTISVMDDSAPVFDFLPAGYTTSCSELDAPYEMSATDNCTSSPEITLTEVYTNLGCERLLTRTWVAEDFCGNSTTHTQEIVVVDTDQPTVGDYDAELFFECTDELELTDVEFFDDCTELDIQYSEEVTTGTCSQTYDLRRSWTATDACGNSKSALQIVHVIDSRAPQLNVVEEEITVTCDEIPSIPVLAVFGECGDFETEYSEEVNNLDEMPSSCQLGNAESLSGSVAIWLPTLNSAGSDFVFGNDAGSFTMDHGTGNVHITGQVYNMLNPNQSWILDLHLYDRENWDTWSSNGGGYKDDTGAAGDNYLDWDFYKLSDESMLIGAGEFEGSELNLTHTPADYSYGFQMGRGANNRNAENGISGWFFYEGNLNGDYVFGSGDLLADMKCCPDQDVIRTWSASDCSGNSTTVTQIIHVRENLPLTSLALTEISVAQFDVLNTTGEDFIISFDSEEDVSKTLTMTDTSGRIVHEVVYDGLEKNTRYTRRIAKNGYLTGMYVFYLKGTEKVNSDKELNLD